MECEEGTDTSDSQAVLASEFSNQAVLLSYEDQGQSEEKLDYMGYENTWKEDDQSPYFSIPSPSAPSNVSLALCDNEPESAFDDLDSLFSSANDQANNSGDLMSVQAEAGVCGLRNLGNTCFLSTGVQCLMATPALVQSLLQPPPAPHRPHSLAAHLARLTHKMWSGRYSAVRPADFKATLAAHYPQFKDFRQHDCQEFLALLLDGLHDQMNTSQKLQELLETDCDMESNPEKLLNQVPDGLSKNLSPNHKNFKEINSEIFKHKSLEKTETLTGSPKIEKINNNCVDSTLLLNTNSKLPLIVNKCNNSSPCWESLVKNDIVAQPIAKEPVQYSVLNNCTTRLNGFEDIIKDAKTSNVNVLVTEQETNNEIRFDSEKFPKSESCRRRETFSYNSFHLYENNVTSGKRGKSTVTHYQNAVELREGLDLKRLKLQRSDEAEEDNAPAVADWEKNHRMEDERKLTASSKSLEKNYRMECERRERDGGGAGPSSADCVVAPRVGEDAEAEAHWQKHLAAHQSVIVDTFQGQFKSTVVCSKCSHVSVTFEPFMYLSVPLPHAMERQLTVTFVSARDPEPVQFCVTTTKQDTVGVVKEKLLQVIGRPLPHLTLAEVLDCHIAKILNENILVKLINTKSRSLYCFETISFPEFSNLEMPSLDEEVEVSEGEERGSSLTCTICLEEQETSIRRHDTCSCLLCDSCVVRTSQHYKNSFECPVCHLKLTPEEDLVSIAIKPDTSPVVRMLSVSLVFRLDTAGDGSNNTRTVELFGHPRLLRLPSRLESQLLHQAIASVIGCPLRYKLLLVDGKGHHCSRCMFTAHCRGCPVPSEGLLVLGAGDSLAAMFTDPAPGVDVPPALHASMRQLTSHRPLSLYDCIQAFSQSEMLDENNPWYCPSCKKNQCATKTLSVWRYPNYLIIYLKRFVFEDCVSTKLDDKVLFPLQGLNIAPGNSYDLYACVCHVGGVSAGHYTAYTLHSRTEEWYHYNDDFVTKQPPQEDDYSNAYILFYKKQGVDFKSEDCNTNLDTNCEPFS